MRYALAFVCGGASDLSKSQQVLHALRYRRGRAFPVPLSWPRQSWPQPDRDQDGRAFELTYRQLWEDEDKWMIQPRCKICPTRSARWPTSSPRCWLNGGPAVDDEALNGIIVRTRRGLELFDAAVAAAHWRSSARPACRTRRTAVASGAQAPCRVGAAEGHREWPANRSPA